MSDHEGTPSPVEFLFETEESHNLDVIQNNYEHQQQEQPHNIFLEQPSDASTLSNIEKEQNTQQDFFSESMAPHSESTMPFEFTSFSTTTPQTFVPETGDEKQISTTSNETEFGSSNLNTSTSNSFPNIPLEIPSSSLTISNEETSTLNLEQITTSTEETLNTAAKSMEQQYYLEPTPKKKPIIKSSSFVHEIVHEGDSDTFLSYGSDTDNTLSHSENFAVSTTSPVVANPIVTISPQEGQHPAQDSSQDFRSPLLFSTLLNKEVASILLDKHIDEPSVPYTQVELSTPSNDNTIVQTTISTDTVSNTIQNPVEIELTDFISSTQPKEEAITIPQDDTNSGVLIQRKKKKKKKKKKVDGTKQEQGKLKVKQKNPVGVFIKVFLGDRSYIYVFLTILSVLAGIIAYLTDMTIKYAQLGRSKLVDLGGGNYWAEITILSIFNAIFVAAASILVWQVPPAEGGGLAALKAILNGANLTGPLEFKTLVVKIITIPMVLIAGMNVGKLGPSIHTITMLGYSMAKMPFFRKINESKYLRDQLIACGCAIGLGAVHITPLAGVLLGIEVIGTYFPFRAYIKSFYGALVAGITYSVLQSSFNQSWFFFQTWRSNFVFPAYTIPEIFIFALIGLIMGVIGPVIVFAFEYCTIIRESFGRRFLIFKFPKLQNKWFSILFQNIFYFIIFVSVLTSILQHPKTVGSFMSGGLSRSLEDLAMTGPMTKANGANASDWMDLSDPTKVLRNVAAFFFLKGLLALSSIWLPIPCGSLLPCMVMGGAAGRLLGETIVYFNGGKYISDTLNPGGLALVASASLGVAVTHAFSTVFLCLEAFGISYHLPCMIGALAAMRVSSSLSLSVYEVTIKLRKWNALLEMKTDNVDNNVATKKLMQPVSSMLVLTKIMTLKQIIEVLEDNMHKDVKEFPVVQDTENMVLLGFQTRADLDNMCKSLLEKGTNLDEQFYIYCKVCPCLLSEETSLIQIHKMFSMLLLEYGYVIENGKLVGQVTRADLRAYADKHRTLFTIIHGRLKQLRGALKNL